jgi:Tfp pilus assembly protein PilO
MTARDRLVAIVLVALALLAACWFMLVAPKRSEASSLNGKISVQQTALSSAQSTVASNAHARVEYNRDYATVARLGKAVPSDAEVASLLVQLQAAAQSSHVDFREIDEGASSIGPTPTAPTATDSAATTTATTATTPATAAPVSATDTTSLAPGSAVGSASLTTIPFQLTFEGTYFQLVRFIQAVQSFASVQRKTISVHGRLLVIGSVTLAPGPGGFPKIKASIDATGYELPAQQGLTAGATPAGPAATTGTVTPTSSTSTTATTAAATPAPAATASVGGTP